MITRTAIARSACAVAVLAAVGLLVAWLPTAMHRQPRLTGRWKANYDGMEHKVHFFQGQDSGDGVVRGHFSERASDGYRGAGQYELRMDGERDGTIALHGHSLGTLTGSVHLGSRRMDLAGVDYFRQ